MQVIKVKPIEIRQAEEMQKISETILADSNSMKLESSSSYEWACGYLRDIKSKMKTLDAERKKITAPLDQAKKAVMDLFRKPLDNFTRAENLVKRSLLTYQAEQEKIRKAQEAKLEAAATKRRIEAEQKAEEFAKKGNEKKSQEWLDKAGAAVAPVMASRVEKQEGISTQKVYKFEVFSVDRLPREWMIPNEKKIGEVVRATKATMAIPGVKIWAEDTLKAGS